MSQRRRKPLSPHLPDAHDGSSAVFTPLGYVLEWTPQSHHRHRLDTLANLRSELLGGEPPGVEQLIVLRGHLAPDTADALRSLAGVDDGFLDAYMFNNPFRPRGRAAKSANWWTWRFPAEDEEAGRIARAWLWLSSPIPVLLVDKALEPLGREEKKHKPAPRLRHQDAATRRSGLHHGGGRYGAVATYHPSSPRPQQERRRVKTIDEELCSAMDHVQDVVLEEMLAEIVYERWTACLGALRLHEDNHHHHHQHAPRLLWTYMVALEYNLDDARCCARQGRFVEHASPQTWTDLSQRAHLRIQLATASSRRPPHHRDASTAPPPPPPSSSHKDESGLTANERSLDRIAYLGGMLLPVSVVASILAIEGRYGPEGTQFWVFWAASVVASVAALLIIYLDQLRLADVWVEIPGRGGGSGDGDAEQAIATSGLGVVGAGGGTKVVAAARAWHREQLGWARALKQMSGYYRLRGARWIRFQSPARVVKEERKDEIIVVEEE